MIVMTDRGSRGLLVRVTPRSARIGLPEPPAEFAHNEDEWFLSVGASEKEPLDSSLKLDFAAKVQLRRTRNLHAIANDSRANLCAARAELPRPKLALA